MVDARVQNAKEIARLRALPSQIRAKLTGTIGGFGSEQVLAMKNRFSGRPALIARTGGFRASFADRAEETSEGPMVSVFTTGTAHRTRTLQPFAGVQEGYGGKDVVINARLKKYLAIPLSPANVGPSGLPQYTRPADLKSAGLTRLIKTRSGKLLIQVREGDGWKSLWVLKRSVTIPARLKFFETFKALDDVHRRKVIKDVGDAIRAN